MIHRILSSVGILVFALGTVVLADPPTVSIQQQATLDQIVDPVFGDVINLGAVVTVVVNCGDGDPSEFQLEVAVRQGDVAGTSGGVFIPSTGGRQVVSVEAFGPFNPGDASASATLVCGPLAEGLQLGATIKISE